MPGEQRTEDPLTTQPVKSEASDGAPQGPHTSGQPHAVPFRDLGVDEVICTALEAAGIYATFPIQALTLPLAIDGQDIIGQARTGTGKTLAFGIPLLHRLATTFAADRTAKQPSALVVVPTRELAIQVADDIVQAGRDLGARIWLRSRFLRLARSSSRPGVPTTMSVPAARPSICGSYARPPYTVSTRASTSILSRWCVR